MGLPASVFYLGTNNGWINSAIFFAVINPDGRRNLVFFFQGYSRPFSSFFGVFVVFLEGWSGYPLAWLHSPVTKSLGTLGKYLLSGVEIF